LWYAFQLSSIQWRKSEPKSKTKESGNEAKKAMASNAFIPLKFQQRVMLIFLVSDWLTQLYLKLKEKSQSGVTKVVDDEGDCLDCSLAGDTSMSYK
jgi:hypothetical protein